MTRSMQPNMTSPLNIRRPGDRRPSGGILSSHGRCSGPAQEHALPADLALDIGVDMRNSSDVCESGNGYDRPPPGSPSSKGPSVDTEVETVPEEQDADWAV